MKFTLSVMWAVIVLLVFFVFSGCSSSNSSTTAKPNAVTQPSTVTKPNTPSPSTVVNKAPDPTPPSGSVLVKSNDSNVTIFVPTGWNTNATQLYPGSIIGVSDDVSKAYLIITEKTKASVKANSTINDYINQAKTAFSTAVTNPVWGEPVDVTIGGCKGQTIRLTGKRNSNGTDTVYFLNIVESKTYYYDVCGYTLTASESTNKPTLDAIINSFKEKD
jgi:hypothetical protein